MTIKRYEPTVSYGMADMEEEVGGWWVRSYHLDSYIQLAAAMYQAAGSHNFPLRWMDCLSAAQNGEPFEHMLDGLLPISVDEEGFDDKPI